MSFKTYPAPNETGTLRVYYYKRPAALATTDNSDANTDVGLPTGWEDIVTAYAEFRALRKGRDPRWQEAAAEYNTQLERFKMIAIRWTDQAGQMGPSQMWGVPEWLVFDDGGGWW